MAGTLFVQAVVADFGRVFLGMINFVEDEYSVPGSDLRSLGADYLAVVENLVNIKIEKLHEQNRTECRVKKTLLTNRTVVVVTSVP